MDFEVGHHLGNGRWEQIGRVIAEADPASAMRSWIERIGFDPGEYGIRRSDRETWSLYVVSRERIRSVDHFG
jgi:hypothetical protein